MKTQSFFYLFFFFWKCFKSSQFLKGVNKKERRKKKKKRFSKLWTQSYFRHTYPQCKNNYMGTSRKYLLKKKFGRKWAEEKKKFKIITWNIKGVNCDRPALPLLPLAGNLSVVWVGNGNSWGVERWPALVPIGIGPLAAWLPRFKKKKTWTLIFFN